MIRREHIEEDYLQVYMKHDASMRLFCLSEKSLANVLFIRGLYAAPALNEPDYKERRV